METKPYKYGGSKLNRKLGKSLLWLSRRLSKFSYRARLLSWALFKSLSNKGNSLISNSKQNVLDRLKISIESPRSTRFEFFVNGEKRFLFLDHDKTEETTKRYIDFKKGELDIEPKIEHYTFICNNSGRWRV